MIIMICDALKLVVALGSALQFTKKKRSATTKMVAATTAAAATLTYVREQYLNMLFSAMACLNF